MTLAELKQILDTTGYPVTYSHFKKTETIPLPNPPFITYLVPGTSNLFADDKTYMKINNIRIELYTDKKDLAAEEFLEDILDQHDLPYESDEAWIKEESLFQKTYEVSI